MFPLPTPIEFCTLYSKEVILKEEKIFRKKMFFAKHVELNKPSLPKVSNNRLSNRPFLFLRWTYTVYLQHHFYNVVLCWVLAEDTEDVADVTTRDLTRPLNKQSTLLIAREGHKQFSKILENNTFLFFFSLLRQFM